MDKETADAAQKILGFAWAFGIAALAGFVKYLQRFRGDDAAQWKWIQFAVQVFTAGFVGLVTTWLLSGWNVPDALRTFAIAVAGWGGGETIDFFQQVLRDAITRAAQASEEHDAKN